MPGFSELVLILVIVLVVFGARRIPEIMGGVGKGIKDFKRAVETDEPESSPKQAASVNPSENKARNQ